MNSQLNNQQTENQDQQIFSAKEDQFRPVFFEPATKRQQSTSASAQLASSSASSASAQLAASSEYPSSSTPLPSTSSNSDELKSNKRARLDVLQQQLHTLALVLLAPLQLVTPTPLSPNSSSPDEPCTTSNTPLAKPLINFKQKRTESSKSTRSKLSKQDHTPNLSNIKRYRSRSLPNVFFSLLRRRHHHHHAHGNNLQYNHSHFGTPSENVINAVPSMAFSFPQQQPFFPPTNASTQKISQPPPLPPVSLQSLREIDLHEILKNPQLRHDILFDPQLQFRPNLDGERGRKKKMAVDKYWEDVQRECESYIVEKKFNQLDSRLPPLFQTLKEILISLLPSKDVEQVNEVMDIDLLIQQLKKFAFDFVSLAQWLSQIFKSHCAPMRDLWVDEMTMKFTILKQENSISSLVDGLRMIFSILELMKLDVANHQIRILRPVLMETLVDFERNYFTQMINRCKMNLQDSTSWFVTNYQSCQDKSIKLKELSTMSILKLLSCRHMVMSFPTSLSFDHARLVLLRADIRQLVCLQLCILLFKQMLFQEPASVSYRQELVKPESINRLKKEILAIVTNDNGNIKWTRNVGAISLQLCKLVITSPEEAERGILKTPKESTVEFAFNWLIKQTQPSSNLYGIMEERIFKQLLEIANVFKDDEMLKEESNSSAQTTTNTSAKSTITQTSTSPTVKEELDENNELNQLGMRVAKLCNFHWNVFGNTYTEAITNHKQQEPNLNL